VARVGHEDPWHPWTQACLHGLHARSSDDLKSLDHSLPPHIAKMAREVAEALTAPEPPTRRTVSGPGEGCTAQRP
jgi:hypothetical protein